MGLSPWGGGQNITCILSLLSICECFMDPSVLGWRDRVLRRHWWGPGTLSKEREGQGGWQGGSSYGEIGRGWWLGLGSAKRCDLLYVQKPVYRKYNSFIVLVFSVTLRFLFSSDDDVNLCREKARKEIFFPPSWGQGIRRGTRSSHCGGRERSWKRGRRGVGWPPAVSSCPPLWRAFP